GSGGARRALYRHPRGRPCDEDAVPRWACLRRHLRSARQRGSRDRRRTDRRGRIGAGRGRGDRVREQVAAPRSVRLPYQSDGPVRGDELTLTHRPFSYAFYVAPANLRTTIALGITTVRDAGGADLGLKRAVE